MLIIDSFAWLCLLLIVLCVEVCVVCRPAFYIVLCVEVCVVCRPAFYSFLVTCILAWYELMDLQGNCECVID